MRVTTEENVKEVLAEIDKEISKYEALIARTPIERPFLPEYSNRKWGLERARLIIVSTLTFEEAL